MTNKKQKPNRYKIISIMKKKIRMPSVKLPPLTPLFQMIRPLKTLGVRGNSPNLGVGRFSKRCRGDKKKTHRRAVGVFCESAPAALEPSGPKKRINEQNMWAWLPKQKMLMFHRLTFQRKQNSKKRVCLYMDIFWDEHEVDMIHIDIIYIILDETMYHNPDFTTSRRWHLCLERKPIMTSRV